MTDETLPDPPTGLRRLLAESPRPRRVAGHRNAHWFVVGTVCIGAFMGQLDASIVTVAFPTMQKDFGATLGSVEWVALSYLLVLIGTVTAVGRFSDMIGRKLLYTYGFIVFTGASALCAVAPNLLVLDGFRVLQAVGAAMLQANSVALITHAMPADQLGRGIGVQGAAQATGLALGPTVGGFLIGLGGWPLIFYVNVPAGILGVALGWVLLPRSRTLQERTAFDWLGLGLFLPGISALLLMLSFGRQVGFRSPLIVSLGSAAVLLLGIFVWHQRRTPEPMMDLKLFRRVPFSAGVASGLLSYLTLFGVLFVVPFFLERARGLTPGQAGIRLTVLPVALGLVAPFAGHLADRFGARPLTVGGMVLTAGALAGLAFLHRGDVELLITLAVAGVGMGAFTPPNNAAIMGAAPRHQSGVAAGILNMTRGVGTAMGVAVTGLVFSTVAGHTVSASTNPASVADGFTAALLVLAAIAVLAAVLAAARGSAVTLAHGPMTLE